MLLSTPKLLQPGEWHLPYITDREADGRWGLPTLKMMSTARCARLSYKPFDGEADVNAEIARYEKLVVSRPVHASPAEHQATPDQLIANGHHWSEPHLHGNFDGWVQYRKMLPAEVVR